MKGIRAYDCSAFHAACTGVVPIDVGGFAFLWCPTCRVLANMEAVSPKFASWGDGVLEARKDDKHA